MRAKEWFQPVTVLLLGAVLTAGCATTSDTPQGVAETGDGAFTLSTRGPTAAAAVERGLNQASQHCADQNRMIAVQSTRIERDGYNIAFRCLSVPGAPGGTQVAAATPAVAAVAAPEPATPAPTPAAVVAEPMAPPMATPAPVTAEPIPAPSPAPVMAEPIPPAAAAPVAPAPVAAAPSLPPAAAPAARPVSPGGTPLPTASSPLPPIAGSGSPGLFARPAPSATPSTFWQAGR